MNQAYVCPTCKNDLGIEENDSYFCRNCEISYNTKDNYVDFISESTFYAGEVPKAEMDELINNIDTIGFSPSLSLFFRKFPRLRGYITDKKRADWVYNVLGTERKNCLDIGSGLGNISENLSYIFENVYSVEAVKERIDFQNRRFKNSDRSNIYISRGNALSLPFKDNYFDFIVCNGVLEWMGMMNTEQNPRETQLSFLRELKRVLKDNGKIYIGIENRLGLNLILGDKDHSGLRYTSLMPRFLANYVVRKYGNSGGIYGDSTTNKKEEYGYFTFTYSIFGYKSLFKNAGLKVKSFWVYPSYNQPYFSGHLEDKTGIKGFINTINIQSDTLLSTSRIKMAIAIASKINKSVVQFILGILTPSFLFYCGKNDVDLPIYEYLSNQTSLTSITSLCNGDDIKYLLYDREGKLKKTVHMKRDLKYFPGNIRLVNKTNPDDLPSLSEKIWIEDWIPGRKIDPLNFKEVKMAIEWLINFQNCSKKEIMTREFLTNETDKLRAGIMSITERENSKYIKIIDNYELYLINKEISIIPEHGDYFFGNILIDNAQNLFVIDWAYYRKRGDPFFDPIFFIIQVIIHFKRQYPSNTLKDIMSKDEIKELKTILENHFGQELNFQLLILYNLLRFINRIITKKGILENELIGYYELTDEIINLNIEVSQTSKN
jgi:ubiquinone/menaquinone biosynthesis C-methylase UbiE/thiamine kinase-like enzyme